MSAIPGNDRRVVLARRPSGEPVEADFRLEEAPAGTPGDGEVLLETLYLSLDPYMRGRMAEGPSYAQNVAVGEPMVGQGVARVLASGHPDYREGDLVLAPTGWRSRPLLAADDLMRRDPAMERPAYALGVLGMPGFTAYIGLLDIGEPKPGETVVVSAATGAVGSVVGQIAKLKGCRVVGVAGGEDKCRHAVDDLGFDACIDRRGGDLDARLAAACPDGIDIYFENVGGAVFAAVLPLLNVGARVPVCGLIAHYNTGFEGEGPDRSPRLMVNLVIKRIRMQGFLVFDHYGPRYDEFVATMNEWLRDGAIRYREDVADGLENAPQAFIGMLRGENVGKQVVRVAGD